MKKIQRLRIFGSAAILVWSIVASANSSVGHLAYGLYIFDQLGKDPNFMRDLDSPDRQALSEPITRGDGSVKTFNELNMAQKSFLMGTTMLDALTGAKVIHDGEANRYVATAYEVSEELGNSSNCLRYMAMGAKTHIEADCDEHGKLSRAGVSKADHVWLEEQRDNKRAEIIAEQLRLPKDGFWALCKSISGFDSPNVDLFGQSKDVRDKFLNEIRNRLGWGKVDSRQQTENVGYLIGKQKNSAMTYLQAGAIIDLGDKLGDFELIANASEIANQDRKETLEQKYHKLDPVSAESVRRFLKDGLANVNLNVPPDKDVKIDLNTGDVAKDNNKRPVDSQCYPNPIEKMKAASRSDGSKSVAMEDLKNMNLADKIPDLSKLIDLVKQSVEYLRRINAMSHKPSEEDYVGYNKLGAMARAEIKAIENEIVQMNLTEKEKVELGSELGKQIREKVMPYCDMITSLQRQIEAKGYGRFQDSNFNFDPKYLK